MESKYWLEVTAWGDFVVYQQVGPGYGPSVIGAGDTVSMAIRQAVQFVQKPLRFALQVDIKGLAT